MHDFAHLASRPHTAGLIVALILGGCSGPAVIGNTPGGTSAGTTTPPTTTTTTTATPITLQGSPPTSVVAGAKYSFQPTVSPATAAVTFTISQKPAWASFNSSTGALSGTPAASNVGTAANITITASNGSSAASVGPFSVVVVAAPAGSPPSATGSATLTWIAPTLNSDGTALTNLAGYHIHYGTNASDLTQVIDLAGAAATTYVVSNLAPGTYYFAVTAYSSTGAESTESDPASKAI